MLIPFRVPMTEVTESERKRSKREREIGSRPAELGSDETGAPTRGSGFAHGDGLVSVNNTVLYSTARISPGSALRLCY